MATHEIREYYDATSNRETRDDLRFAVSLVTASDPVAIDCGCGAGSDIAFLRSAGFTVHGFDVEPEAIARCRTRFDGDERVILSQASFRSFDYPRVSLIAADASLFFCPAADFDDVWTKITAALGGGGVFCGAFLGPRDTMAGGDYERDKFWPDVMTVTERTLRPRFRDFDIVRWVEHEMDGTTAQGRLHHWHIFSVVARRD